MDHTTQVAILGELLQHVGMGTTAQHERLGFEEAETYTSPHVLAAEKAGIFMSEPLVVALSCELPEPGSYIAERSLHIPYIVLRGKDGRVRAFLNACRHRGTQLVEEGRGRKLRFTCPFHAWTYDDRGSLIGVPLEKSTGVADRSCLSLIELPAAEKHGIIWIRLRPGAPIDPELALEGLAQEIAGWRLADKFPLQTQTLRRKMNWKLANDTFGETYHFAILHRDTLSATYYSNVTAYETFGRNHRMVFAARTIEELRGQPVGGWRLRPHATIAYFLFPNTQVLIAPSSVAVYRLAPDPEQPERCVIRQSLFLDEEPVDEAGEDTRRRTLDVHEQVIVNEDFVVAESAQAALSSGLMPRVVFGRNEPALHHYHAALREARGRGSDCAPDPTRATTSTITSGQV